MHGIDLRGARMQYAKGAGIRMSREQTMRIKTQGEAIEEPAREKKYGGRET